MSEYLTLLLIGIGLSMDTFSISLSIGTLKITSNQIKLISIIVSIMHFIMPLIGQLIGVYLLSIFPIHPSHILSIILYILAIKLIKEFNNVEEPNIKLNLLGMLLFAIAVSIDSFTTGIALFSVTTKTLLAITIFSVCSFCFTFMGLTIGRYTSNRIGKYATLLGIIILLLVATTHLIG